MSPAFSGSSGGSFGTETHWDAHGDVVSNHKREAVKIDVPVFGGVILDETRIALALASQGGGLIYAAEPILAPLIEAGTLQVVLEDWASVSPGFHIYYSSYRQQPLGLRLLIDLIREIDPLKLRDAE